MDGAPDSSAELFRIDWNRHSPAQWQALFDSCVRPPLTQSPAYAAALAASEGAASDFGLIRFQGRPIGMAVVTRRTAFGGVAQCSLYRGPVWIHEEIPGQMLQFALGQLRRRYRWWRRRPLTFHPELADTAPHRASLAGAGFRRVADGYATVWLDLSPPLADLRAGLRAQWRNKLGQAERHGVAVGAADSDTQFEWLYDKHASHMAALGYRGPAPTLLRALRAHAPAGQDPILLIAHHDGAPVAGLYLCHHGSAATYLVGWTGDEGRRLRAQNLLLWRAVETLKGAGVRWFDLGGITAEAPGLARFKQDMGGATVTLVGGYV